MASHGMRMGGIHVTMEAPQTAGDEEGRSSVAAVC